MRLLFELLIIAALIAAAWEKSYQERLGEALPMFAKGSSPPPRAEPARRAAPAASAQAAAPAASPSGAWMWDPKRKSALDPKPSPEPTRP